jgi:leader peptidase (prepilin peptidase)/N-methyltransferase
MDPVWIDIFWLTFVFAVGSCVGSFLNVVVARLPLEKSLIWPSSRCGTCLQAIKGTANLPVLGYLMLRGQCRSCGARFSSRYMWVELATGLAFTGLFYLDIIRNRPELPFVRLDRHEMTVYGWVPWPLWALFAQHATLLALLIAASLCDLDGKVIPLPLTMTGTVIGMAFSTLFPWPWPSETSLPDSPLWFLPEAIGKIPRGITNWPFWWPLPDWLPPGSVQLGFANSLVGAAVGNLMMRSVKFIFEQGLGKEALGLGDADLMMMAGAFLGWQAIVIAFFLGTFAALFFAIPAVIRSGQNVLPFGPGLAVGILITMLNWHIVGPVVQPFLFEWMTMLVAGFFMGGGMFVASLALGQRHRG